MARVLRRHHGEVPRGGAVLLHVLLRHHGVDVHEHRPGAARSFGSEGLASRVGEFLHHVHRAVRVFHVHRAGEGAEAARLVFMEELLVAASQDDVVVTGADHGAGLLERRRRRSAGVLHVDHRDAADAHAAQDHFAANHFLTGDHPGGSVAHPGSL
ncbi:hypothetical protein D3C81_1582630 [compost metagenome]